MVAGAWTPRDPARSLRTCSLIVLAWTAGTACAPSVVYFGRSPDRRHTVRVVESASKQYVEVDGVGDVGYRAVGVEGLVFSADSARIAFPVLTHTGWAVVHDGVLGDARWDGIGEVALSEDGAHLAYVGLRGSNWHLVQDGAVGPTLVAIARGSMRYAPRDRLAYVEEVRTATRAAVRAVVDGRAGPLFEAIEEVVFSEDGTRFAYAASRNRGWHVVEGEVIGARHDRVHGLCFAGERTVYLAEDDGRWSVDGVVSGGRLSELRCGREAIAYVVSEDGRSSAMIAGAEKAEYGAVTSLSITADGTHHAYIARSPKKAVIVHDDAEHEVDGAEVVELSLSRDGEHWAALIADVSEKKLWIAIDGERYEPFDLEELVGHGLEKKRVDPEVLRRWLAADLERALDACGEKLRCPEGRRRDPPSPSPHPPPRG